MMKIKFKKIYNFKKINLQQIMLLIFYYLIMVEINNFYNNIF